MIDVVCYRRYGHNEGDEPMFTQPLMYKKIANLPRPREIYGAQLVKEGTLTQEQVDAKLASFKEYLEGEFNVGKDYKPNKADMLEGEWSGLVKPDKGLKELPETGVEIDKLKEIGKALAKKPENFALNRKVEKLLEAKEKMIETGEGFDWAMAEALAFGSLLKEGKPVRLSGQDCGRWYILASSLSID